MSFALEVKNDLIKINNQSVLKLEIEAMLRFAGEVIISRPFRIEFNSNNLSIVRYLITILKKYYQFEYDIESRNISRFDNHTTYKAIIKDGADLIIKDLNLIGSESEYKKDMLNDEAKVISYLKGAFLAKGTVNDPAKKNSHLEIVSIDNEEILFIQKCMNYFEINARITKRKNYLVCYIKSQESIGDFLYRIGATSSMNYYENTIITKEIAASAKRSINLDIANQDKTNHAAKEQLKYIEYLTYNYPLEKLDSKLLMVMKVRSEHPEHSLTQLLDIIHDEYDPNLSKSGLNHRLRRLKELALEYKNGSK